MHLFLFLHHGSKTPKDLCGRRAVRWSKISKKSYPARGAQGAWIHRNLTVTKQNWTTTINGESVSNPLQNNPRLVISTHLKKYSTLRLMVLYPKVQLNRSIPACFQCPLGFLSKTAPGRGWRGRPQEVAWTLLQGSSPGRREAFLKRSH